MELKKMRSRKPPKQPEREPSEENDTVCAALLHCLTLCVRSQVLRNFHALCVSFVIRV